MCGGGGGGGGLAVEGKKKKKSKSGTLLTVGIWGRKEKKCLKHAKGEKEHPF